jgi:nitrogen-specific signal transduction histidine kinase
MTTQQVTLKDGRTGFQAANGGGAAEHTATTDLTNILDAVDTPVVVVRRDLMLVYYNNAAADVLGLSPSGSGPASRALPVLAGLPRLEEECSRVVAGGVESRDRRQVVRRSDIPLRKK